MNSQNNYKKIFVSATALNIVARGLNFLIGVYLAKHFLPVETDLYLFVWNIISVFLAFTGSIDLLLVLPTYIRYKIEKGIAAANDLSNIFFWFYFTTAFVIGLLVVLFPREVFRIISGFSENQLSGNFLFLRMTGLWLLFSLIHNYFSNLLTANKYFAVALLGQVFVGATTIGCLFYFREDIGGMSFLWGQLAGQAICLIFYSYVLYTKVNWRIAAPVFRLSRVIWKELGSLMAGALPVFVRNYLGFYLLSRLGPGFLSSYNYGSALANIPDVIFTSQIAVIAGVKLSETHATEGEKGLLKTYDTLSRHMLFFISGIAIIASVCSPLIIHFIYGNTSLKLIGFHYTEITLTLLALTLPIKSIDVLNNRLIASLQRLAFSVKFILPLHFINIIILVALTKFFGFYGFLSFQLLAPLLVVFVQFVVIKKLFSRMDLRSMIRRILFFLFCCGLHYLLGYSLYLLTSAIPLILRFILISLSLVIAGLFVNYLLRFSDIPAYFFNAVYTRAKNLVTKHH